LSQDKLILKAPTDSFCDLLKTEEVQDQATIISESQSTFQLPPGLRETCQEMNQFCRSEPSSQDLGHFSHAVPEGSDNVSLHVAQYEPNLAEALELSPQWKESLCCKRDKMLATPFSASCAELNGQDQRGFAPLHYAAMGGFTEIVAALLHRGRGDL
jgi:hypothetical protein